MAHIPLQNGSRSSSAVCSAMTLGSNLSLRVSLIVEDMRETTLCHTPPLLLARRDFYAVIVHVIGCMRCGNNQKEEQERMDDYT